MTVFDVEDVGLARRYVEIRTTLDDIKQGYLKGTLSSQDVENRTLDVLKDVPALLVEIGYSDRHNDPNRTNIIASDLFNQVPQTLPEMRHVVDECLSTWLMLLGEQLASDRWAVSAMDHLTFLRRHDEVLSRSAGILRRWGDVRESEIRNWTLIFKTEGHIYKGEIDEAIRLAADPARPSGEGMMNRMLANTAMIQSRALGVEKGLMLIEQFSVKFTDSFDLHLADEVKAAIFRLSRDFEKAYAAGRTAREGWLRLISEGNQAQKTRARRHARRLSGEMAVLAAALDLNPQEYLRDTRALASDSFFPVNAAPQ